MAMDGDDRRRCDWREVVDGYWKHLNFTNIVDGTTPISELTITLTPGSSPPMRIVQYNW
jgi:hypothetical protein